MQGGLALPVKATETGQPAQATLECEAPNANLHKFQGRLKYTADGEGARLLCLCVSCWELLMLGRRCLVGCC